MEEKRKDEKHQEARSQSRRQGSDKPNPHQAESQPVAKEKREKDP